MRLYHITTERFTNFSIAFFMVTFVGMYYSEYIKLVWVGYILLTISICMNSIKRKLFNPSVWHYVGWGLLFTWFCFTSIIWSYDFKVSVSYFNQLMKVIGIFLLFILLMQSENRLKIALLWLCIGATLYGLLYLLHIDITQLGASRLSVTNSSDGQTLPNYNLVSMYVAFAAIYFVWRLLLSNQQCSNVIRIALISILIISVITVFIFGSRKSILMLFMGIAYFIFCSHLKMKTRFALTFLIACSVIIVLILLPEVYVDYLISRFESLITSNQGSRLEAGDQERIKLYMYAEEFILRNPIFGNGFYCFSPMFLNATGKFLYAHNNYVEVICDLGIIGLLILYYPILKSTYRGWKIRNRSSLCNILTILGILNLFGGLFIVTFLDRITWLICGIIYIGINMEYKKLLSKRKPT